MTGRLPKEILDHLEHAGYVAVPKERVGVLWAERTSPIWEAACVMDHQGLRKTILGFLGHRLGMEIIKGEFCGVEVDTLDREGTIRTRACVHVVKPRTLAIPI
jgi:hypothetical protein